MSKGSTPSGSTTVTTVNPSSSTQLPYLTGGIAATGGNQGANVGWNQAVNLAQFDPYAYYPNQTLATPDNSLVGGWQTLATYGQNANNAAGPAAAAGQGYAANAENNFLTGQNANSPAAGLYRAIMGGTAAPYPQVDMLGNLSSAALQGNAGTNQLAATANGNYLGANPYIASEYAAAAQPVVNAYQTATAPQTDSNFEAAGRYGSGANANAQSQNQLNLGTTLGNLSANLYGQDYANERGLQTNAAGTLGSLTNQGNQLAQSANAAGGNLLLGEQGAATNAANGLQSGWQTGNAQQLQSLLMEPSIASLPTTDINNMITGGQDITNYSQQQINDAMARFYGSQQAPYQTNEAYLAQIGQPIGGTSSTTSPYFTNPIANALGAATGGVGLYNGVNSALGAGKGGKGAGAYGTALATTAGL